MVDVIDDTCDPASKDWFEQLLETVVKSQFQQFGCTILHGKDYSYKYYGSYIMHIYID